MKQLLDRIKGTIYGQAIGDALGLGTEGMDVYDMAWKYPNGFTHYSEIFQDRSEATVSVKKSMGVEPLSIRSQWRVNAHISCGTSSE